MVHFTGGLFLFTALRSVYAAPADHNTQQQNVLDISHARPQIQNPRKLNGRFLHITDIHPDPFYKRGSSPTGEHPCHRGGGEGTAGYFGAEKTECDSPFTLIDATFEWIKRNIRDDIDFVIWTGDSARHDNDEKYPRSNKQVEQLNAFVVEKFDEVFGKPDNRDDPDPTNDFVIPIVPTYGNNDILPHNIFTPGPNRWTRKYLTIWEKFIPQAQRHSFARGGWFFTEVIPNKLAVFSLNTIYFFDSNAAVDGCYEPSEPGYEHFEWLRVQLELLRQRGMKAILMGHVPPARTESKQAWDETCYQKYTLWLRQFRDVIVGNLYGHMNIDHFMLQDVRDLTYKFKIPGTDRRSVADDSVLLTDDDMHVSAKSDYLTELRDHWSALPSPPRMNVRNKHKKQKQYEKYLHSIGGLYGERFSVSLVAPSVVPNFYPTLRIIEYNITDIENDHPASYPTALSEGEVYHIHLNDSIHDHQTSVHDFGLEASLVEDYPVDVAKKRRKKKHSKKKKQRPNFKIPLPPSDTALPGPAYLAQQLSLLSITQLYANLTKINEAAAKELSANTSSIEAVTEDELEVSLLKKHFNFETEYTTNNDSQYKMKDLTMRSWLDLAERISRAEYGKKSADQGFDGSGDLEDEAALVSNSGEDDEASLPEDITAVTIATHRKKRKQKSIKKNKVWHAFVRRAFVGAKTDEELEDEFG